MDLLTPELFPIVDLKPYKLNAKLHPQEQIEKIKRSIQLTGFDQPIVVNFNGYIIKGHGRLEAAKQLGLEYVPVIVLDIDDDVADKARLLDNKSTESDYDIDKLLRELTRFKDSLLDTGYSDSEFDKLLSEYGDKSGVNDVLDSMIENDNQSGDGTKKQGSSKEIDVNDFEFDHKCPKCGFEF